MKCDLHYVISRNGYSLGVVRNIPWYLYRYQVHIADKFSNRVDTELLLDKPIR
jgi:hypothetical protein